MKVTNPLLKMGMYVRLSRERGFALVVTLSLMVLLAILAVGLMGLSSVALRATTADAAGAIARQNARMALILAIGELQKQIGPDQRITANASILDSTPETLAVDGVANPNWLGAWNSWSGINRYSPAHTELKPDLSISREASFRAWLVSGGSVSQLSQQNFATNSVAEDRITLVGKGSLGEELNLREVSVPLVRVNQSRGSGAYAWWIGDESQKATIREGRDRARLNSEPLEALAERDAPSSVGWERLKVLASGELPDREEIRKGTVSLMNIGLIDGVSEEGLKENFHDLTPSARSVIADVREGGLKRDFNLLAEHYSADINAPNALPVSDENMLYDMGGGNRVPLHDLLNYYSLYKADKQGAAGKVLENINGRPSLMTLSPQEFNASNAQRQITNIYRQPVLARVQFAIRCGAALEDGSTDQYRLKFQLSPHITLWNPYSVPLKLNGNLRIKLRAMALHLQPLIDITGGEQGQGGATTTISGITNGPKINQGGDNNLAALNEEDRTTLASLMIPDTSTLQPGELRIYSVKQERLPDLVNRGKARPFVEMIPGYFQKNGCEVDYYDLQVSDGGSGVNKVRFRETDVVRFRMLSGLPGAAPSSMLRHGQYFAAEVSPNNILGATGGMHTQALHFSMSTTSTPPSINTDLFNYNNELKDRAEARRPISDLVGDGMTFAIMSFGFSGEDEALSQSGQAFRSNPFLHTMFTHATPWIEGVDARSLYDPGYRWSVVKDQQADNEISVTGPNQEFGKFGAGWTRGQKNVIHIEIPQRPFHSLSQFSHASLGGWSIARSGPDSGNLRNMATTAWGQGGLLPNVSRAIGNSYAHPGLPADRAVGTKSDARVFVAGAPAQSAAPYVDHSYLANMALWDEFFMSSIATHSGGLYSASGASDNFSAKDLATRFFGGDQERLPNANLVPAPGKAWAEIEEELFSPSGVNAEAEKIIARYLLLEGGFNVNSTSVESWKAVLSGLRGKPSVSIPVSASGLSTTMTANAGKVPVASLSIPGGAAIEANSSTLSNSSAPEPWVGSFQLTDSQVDELAEAIVAQVKLRGPFLSLSDFVNRRLEGANSGDKFALYGALQAAIEEAGLNDRMKGERTGAPVSGLPFSEAASGPAVRGSNTYINQSDLLRNIDSVIVARGDTFVIRAYGEAKDATGKTTARAWCEATVQRLPDYLDSSDQPEVVRDQLSSKVNQEFGRKIEVVSFRWLSQEEV